MGRAVKRLTSMQYNSGMLLSIAIIAGNEAPHIGACLASLHSLHAALPAEVLVLLDDRTTDATAAIARHHGAQVVSATWCGFPAQRNRALDLCAGEWVLFVDADERVTPELAAEIIALLQGTPPAILAGYRIPRYNSFFGTVVRGGGWYPDHQLRLLRRNRARYDTQQQVHEVAQLQGDEGVLRGHLYHLNIERLDEFWRKQSRYALAEARILAASGRRTRWRNYLGAPAREFWRRYVRLGGWRDGGLGLLLCGTLAWFEVVKFAILHRTAR